MRRQNRKYTEYEVKIRLFLIKYVPLQYTILLIQRKKKSPMTGKKYTTFWSEQNKKSTAKNETIHNLGMPSNTLPSPSCLFYNIK